MVEKEKRPCWKCTLRLVRGDRVGCRRALYNSCKEYQRWQEKHPDASLPRGRGGKPVEEPLVQRNDLSQDELVALKKKVLAGVVGGNIDEEAIRTLVRAGDSETIKLARELGIEA